ncbi:hypothetical protein TRICI_002033 [Trichomonascus ciferrii]|uniref:Uncharacterized protein n=1 Tax=Trichomonascus ciferrii TaxID=44093 RepID=A0A642V7S9_9ASCO|nr:hypothetical protein TRICI_002033 [Trichomonascus ciferrii]
MIRYTALRPASMMIRQPGMGYMAFSTTSAANQMHTPEPIKKASEKVNKTAGKAALKGIEATETVVEGTKKAAKKVVVGEKGLEKEAKNLKEETKEQANDLKEDAKKKMGQ